MAHGSSSSHIHSSLGGPGDDVNRKETNYDNDNFIIVGFFSIDIIPCFCGRELSTRFEKGYNLYPPTYQASISQMQLSLWALLIGISYDHVYCLFNLKQFVRVVRLAKCSGMCSKDTVSTNKGVAHWPTVKCIHCQ